MCIFIRFMILSKDIFSFELIMYQNALNPQSSCYTADDQITDDLFCKE